MDEFIGSKVYCCFKCRNVVGLHDDIISKDYTAQAQIGRAFFSYRLINIVEGPPSDRHFLSGEYNAADVFCSDCREYLGWKYYKAYNQYYQFKENKYCIVKRKICKDVDAPCYL